MKTCILLAIALVLACGSSQKAAQTPPPATESARITPPIIRLSASSRSRM
mgnify:CR=1 FL=1